MKKFFQKRIIRRTSILILLIQAISQLIEGFIKGWNSVHFH